MGRGPETGASALGRNCRTCGNDAWIKYGTVNTKWRCLCCSRKVSQTYQMRRRRDYPALILWIKAKDRAKASGVPFLITVEDVKDVWPKDGRCPVLGVELRRGVGKPGRNSPTLDRLNAAWGYEPGNIAVISSFANRVKSDATANELVQVAQWMLGCGLN